VLSLSNSHEPMDAYLSKSELGLRHCAYRKRIDLQLSTCDVSTWIDVQAMTNNNCLT
jgi:hypothetical protein